MAENTAKIDIIIPTYKPGEKFRRLLYMLSLQSLPVNRLIVINTIPNGESSTLASEFAEPSVNEYFPGDRHILKNITQEEFDHGGTRKYGVSLSDAEIFICMTDDAVPENESLIEKLYEALMQNEKIATAYARQLPNAEAGETERCVRAFNYPDKSMIKGIADIDRLGIKTFFASNVCCAYKRHIYDELGGFTDNAIFNEDMIYEAAALKEGFLCCYQADARVLHSHNYRPMQQLKRNFDLGISQAMHPEIFGKIGSEGEGVRLVKAVVLHLAQKGMLLKIPAFIIDSAFKLAGYRLGRAYKRLPKTLIYRLAMNKTYVRKHLM